MKFDTALDGPQIKKLWKETRRWIMQTGNGDLDDEALKDLVLKRCPFYYTVEPVWASCWSLALWRPIGSTDDLTDTVILDAAPNTNNDSGDSDDASSENVKNSETGGKGKLSEIDNSGDKGEMATSTGRKLKLQML